MRVYKEETQAIKVLESFTCNKCNKDMSDFIASQEALSWCNPCGWGSIFGDGNIISIDLCQECIKDVLGKYIQYEGD